MRSTIQGLHLTHWGRVTHICVSKLSIFGSDNGLSPGRHQAINWTNAGIWLIGPLGTNFSEIFIGIQTFSFKKMHLKMSSAKWRPLCLGLNVLIRVNRLTHHDCCFAAVARDASKPLSSTNPPNAHYGCVWKCAIHGLKWHWIELLDVIFW